MAYWLSCIYTRIFTVDYWFDASILSFDWINLLVSFGKQVIDSVVRFDITLPFIEILKQALVIIAKLL